MTPVPWETGFWLAVLGVSCLTGLFLLSHPIRSKAVLGLAAAAVLGCGVYATLSIYARQTGWHYPFAGGATFGFFPNRNHTATFLVSGSIVALGVLTIALRERRWLLSTLVGAGIAACVAGLFFYSGSRGGVVFLVAGTLIWVAGLGSTHRNVPLLVSVLALAIAAGMLFLVSGGEARTRLLGVNAAKASTRPIPVPVAAEHPSTGSRIGDDHDTPFDFRVLIYQDAAALIGEAPLSGVGLGAFAPVFAQYRQASLSEAAALHPESDWLMLTAEAGAPALGCALVVGGLLFLRLRGGRAHPFWPLRWSCVAAAATAVLHGTVDVPAHRVALGWWILFVAALGFQAGGRPAQKSGFAPRALFLLGGGGALFLGGLLIRAQWMGGRPLPPFAAAEAQDEIQAMFERHQTEAALERARAAVAVSPLAAPLYYQLGTLLLYFEDTDAEADEAFKAQRALNPVSPTVARQQGEVWMGVDPKRTAALWLEALAREDRIERSRGAASDASLNLYRALLGRAASYPGLERDLFSVTARGPSFLLTWLDAVPPDIAREKLADIAARPALLSELSAPERRRFLWSYYTKGERADLTRFLDAHADWAEAARPLRVRLLVDARQFEQAVRAACADEGISMALPPEGTDPGSGPSGDDPVSAFNREWGAGNSVGARRALNEPLDGSQTGTVAAEYWRLKLALAARDQAWPEAWEDLKRYLQTARPDKNLVEW